jgi:hypothetical protein
MNRTHRPGRPGQDLPITAAPAHRRSSYGGSRRYDLVAAVVGFGLVLAIAGCGGPAATTGAATAPAPASAGAAAPGSGAPDPNAPEVVAAGDIPDNQVFVPVTPSGAPISVSVPQGWVQSSDGSATVFTDKFNSVRIETRPLSAAPDVATVRSRDIAQLQGSPGFVLGDVKAVQRTAGAGVLMTYTATSPVNAVTGKSVTEAVERYVFWRGGQEAVLTLSGPQGSDNVDPWRKITDSFRWQQ